MMKQHIEELAIFGGTPAFESPLHVGQPVIGDRHKFVERVNEILDAQWLTNNGKNVKEFEEQISQTVGTKYCVATANGTLGLQLTLVALELKGEVILPSFTFIATAHAIQWQGLTPVFCDINPATGCLDVDKVESLITDKTTAIVGVHMWGNACDIEKLTQITSKHDLRLIFDAAHAFGCSYNGTPIGSFGDAEIFSFHATKFVNALEGGAIVTNNETLANKLSQIRNFGFEGKDEVSGLGINAKMNEISAAMGLVSLDSMSKFVKHNLRNYECYKKGLSNIPGIELIKIDDNEKHNYQYIALTNNNQISGISRDRIMEVLWKENILARRYFYPSCHNMEPYRSLFPNIGISLPETNRLSEQVLCLPTGGNIDENTIESICSIIRILISNSAEIMRSLPN